VISLRTGKQGIGFRFPNKARHLGLLKSVKKNWEILNLILVGYVPGVKRPERDGYHTLSPNAEVCLFVTSGPGAKAPGCTAAIRLIVHPVF
jgi:hypothetical protein